MPSGFLQESGPFAGIKYPTRISKSTTLAGSELVLSALAYRGASFLRALGFARENILGTSYRCL